MPFLREKKYRVSARKTIVFLILLLVLAISSCGCTDERRDQVLDQFNQADETLDSLEIKISDLGAYIQDPENCDPGELQLMIDGIYSDIESSRAILDGIDRSVLTETEAEKLDDVYFAMDCLSGYFDCVAAYLPAVAQDVEDMKSATENQDRNQMRIAVNDMYSLTESYISGLDALEEKAFLKQQSSDSENVKEKCIQFISSLREGKSQGEELLKQLDTIKSVL